MARIKPIQDYVMIKRITGHENTFGGRGIIHLADQSKTISQEGLVYEVGPGLMKPDGSHIPVDVKAEDTVMFGVMSGHIVEIRGQEFLFIRERELIGTILKDDHAKCEHCGAKIRS